MRKIAIIGDVHGYAHALAPLLRIAHGLGARTISVGDLIDRGPNIVETMALAPRLDVILAANHEIKAFQHHLGQEVKLRPHGLKSTLDAIAAHNAGKPVWNDYMARISRSPIWLSFPSFHPGRNLHVVHGAYNPDQRGEPPVLGDVAPSRKFRDRRYIRHALWGCEVDIGADKQELRTDDWLDRVPTDHVVVVGHEVRSLSQVIVTRNVAGGTIIRTDTGIDKGGRLSMVVFDPGSPTATVYQAKPDGTEIAPTVLLF